MPELRLDGTCGLYTVLVWAGACTACTATAGGNWSNFWCAHTGPGGRPTMGPNPPPSNGSTACNVWLASAVGAGFKKETGFRASTSKRGMVCVNGRMLNSKLAKATVKILP